MLASFYNESPYCKLPSTCGLVPRGGLFYLLLAACEDKSNWFGSDEPVVKCVRSLLEVRTTLMTSWILILSTLLTLVLWLLLYLGLGQGRLGENGEFGPGPWVELELEGWGFIVKLRRPNLLNKSVHNLHTRHCTNGQCSVGKGDL